MLAYISGNEIVNVGVRRGRRFLLIALSSHLATIHTVYRTSQ